MSKYLKYFKSEFEKYAQDIGAPPPRPSRGGGAAAKPTAAKPTTTTTGRGGIGGPPARPSAAPARSGGGGYVDIKPIRNMQLAIQNLAKTISATINYDALLKSMQTPPGAPTDQDKSSFQAGYGKDMFSNFMINNYLHRGDVKGVEYDTDPKRTKMLDKKPSDLKSMFVILDSLQRIGREKSEAFADGNWGPRTNNALKNVSAIATAISRLGSELGMQSETFDVSKIAELGSLIPANETDISLQEKIQTAPKITQILTGVRDLFLDFKQQVFMNPTYRNFIEGKAPMMTFGPQKEKGVGETAGEKPILADLQKSGPQSRYVQHPSATMSVTIDKKLIPVQWQNMDVRPFSITAADLLSPQAFDNWVAKSNILMTLKQQNPESWNNVLRSILTQVKAQVDQKLGSAQQGA